MGNMVGWFEIYVEEMERAKTFYESVFQIEFEKLSSPDIDMWAFPSDMNSYGSPGALVKVEGVSAGNNSIMIYFTCEDCSVESGRVKSSGGEVIKPKFSIGEYGFISLVKDSEGNMIGLHSLK